MVCQNALLIRMCWAYLSGSRAVDESVRRSNAGTSEHHPVFYEGDRYESATSLAGLGGGYGKAEDDYDRNKGPAAVRHSSSFGSISESAAERSRQGTSSGFAGFEDVAGQDGGQPSFLHFCCSSSWA